MWLRKTKVPGSAPGGLTWNTLDDVVEVDDELGLELLAIPGAGFEEAPAPARKPVVEAPTTDAAAAPADAEVVEAPAAPKRGRPRKAAQPEISE